MTTYGAVLDALGDPTRRSVLELVAERPQPVGELAARLPVSRPAVSQHLRVLKDAGLVTDTAVGTQRVYRLDARGAAALRAYLDRFWDDSLAAYARAVEQDLAPEERP
ncbi:ArsR/SmtB family transcription factor [Cellulomonas phragmiteti]|uniref:Transcriptional regulator n=1 Tax=Cellulomonas phragmiteti TaxID=478780 RepID=A0ABQ4DPZ2_9CELL|nr:metalloregulator ArsR/SmtB family transcription factor [Cellulomonas phragmiteti]GIG41431.1 transcriptional regulator [Cellulomonas phragmiteti]